MPASVVIHLLPNLGGSGYKLCTKIANALRARSAAIHTAIKCYNEAAIKLAEPQPPLDVKTVLDYVFLAEFDLLQGSRHNLQDKPWSQKAECLAMNTWFKIQCSVEEQDWIQGEAHRLKTWVHDDEAQMTQCLLELQDRDLLMAHQLCKIQVYKVHVNNVHCGLIARLEGSRDWTGPQTIGIHKGIIHHVEVTEESLSEQDGQGEKIELGSDVGSSKGASEDDSAQGQGPVMVHPLVLHVPPKPRLHL